uniref:Nesprin-1 n=1 Tax=Heterorhabditis bacteriophora TaxID=37862 RepID=A0A1I7WNC2_HETBA
MVVPSSRPVAPEDKPTNTTVKQVTRRRPPLNRSIPPIPESKSNESIMSHVSRASVIEKMEKIPPSDCVVIENRCAVETMDRTRSSGVVIPQSKEPLDDKIEEVSIAEQTSCSNEQQTVSVPESVNNQGSKSSFSPVSKNDIQGNVNGTHQSVSVTLNEDVLVVTKETFEDAKTKPSERSDNITADEKIPNESLVAQVQESLQTKNIYSLPSAMVQPLGQFLKEDSEKIILNKQSATETEELVSLENINMKDQAQLKVTDEIPTEKIEKSLMEHSSKSPERYVVTVKTPENYKKEHTIMVKDIALSELEKEVRKTDIYSAEKKLVFQQPEDKEIKSPERYIMTVKTPKSLRKHHIFMVEETKPSDITEKKVSPSHHKKNPVKQQSKPEELKSPERYVMTVKTPEALRKHHTFLIEEKPKSPDVEYIEDEAITEPIATVGPNVGKQIDTKEKKSDKSETTNTPERYVMTAVTPLAMRKYQTFMVEDRPKETPIPYSISADTVIQSKLVPSGSEANKIFEEEPISSQRFVMTATTPLFMRNHKKFRIEQRDPSPSFKREINRERPKKQKSMDETTPMSPEKYILTTTTPLMMRKYHTFFIEDKKQIDLPPKSNSTTDIESSYTKKVCIDDPLDFTPSQPIKPSEMYVLTATTPLPQRKTRVFVIEEKAEKACHDKKEHELEKITREKKKGSSKSPDRKYLSTIGARKSVLNNNVYIVSEKPMQTLERVYKEKIVPEKMVEYNEENEKVVLETMPVESKGYADVETVQTGRTHTLHLDTVTPLKREASQSDRAELLERKASNLSGEMTSPEEDIPMDTHMTPTEDAHDDVIHTQPIRHIPQMTSPITEESEQTPPNDSILMKMVTSDVSTPPVFHPPSPPKESLKTSSKSTSPFKHAEPKIDQISISAIIPETKAKSRLSFRSKSVDRKEFKKSEKGERERVKKEKRDEKDKLPKSPKIPLTTRSLRSASRMLTPAFFRKGESKIPKCIKLPSTSISMPLSPRSQMDLSFRLRHSAQPKGFSDPITEESDGNGNPTTGSQPSSQVFEKCTVSPLMSRHDHDRGLIDDEILDQPMLVGDTFSHSESIDCLSAVRRMEFEADKATLISIDRSLAEDHDICYGRLPSLRFPQNYQVSSEQSLPHLVASDNNRSITPTSRLFDTKSIIHIESCGW